MLKTSLPLNIERWLVEHLVHTNPASVVCSHMTTIYIVYCGLQGGRWVVVTSIEYCIRSDLLCWMLWRRTLWRDCRDVQCIDNATGTAFLGWTITGDNNFQLGVRPQNQLVVDRFTFLTPVLRLTQYSPSKTCPMQLSNIIVRSRMKREEGRRRDGKLDE